MIKAAGGFNMPTMEVVKRRFLVSGQLLHRISDLHAQVFGKIGMMGK